MQETDKKLITPVEAAAAMMQLTMKSIENSWEHIKPAMAVYLTEPSLSEAKEDELIKEIYIAALALEIYCIPHAFEPETARLISSGIGEIMASEHFAAHHLSEPVSALYLPQFEQVSGALLADHALALVEEAARILYGRLELPLKPSNREQSLLWMKLLPFLIQLVGKWPILLNKFAIETSPDGLQA